VGAARGGYAFGDSGLEAFGEIGGNLFGPQAMWIDAGARWLWNPMRRRGGDGVLHAGPLFLGPEADLGVFLRFPGPSVVGDNGVSYQGSTAANATLGLSLDLVVPVTRSFALEAKVGNLRWVPTGSGSILLLGMTAGAGLRF
jgi:hypothetical protein